MLTKESFYKEKYDFDDLLKIMEILRQPGGCPWDAEQNHKSIRKDLLEEAYEVADAIDNDDDIALCEELGDLLLQVAFHTQIAVEDKSFTIDDVTDGVCRKLILRHPHVFGEVKVKDSEEVLDNWDAIKKKEKNMQSYTETLQSVPKAFPALMRAAKVQKRAAKAGFDWDDVSEAFCKIPEETKELENAVKIGNANDINEEFGDLMFACVNVSRFLHLDAEFSLNSATEKFINRFKAVEDTVVSMGKDMKDLSLSELDEIWNQVKNNI